MIEADMERFVALDKDDFTGRAALLTRKQRGVAWKRAYLAIEAPHLDVLGSEQVYHGDGIVGTITSGAYGHTVGKSLAFAYLDPQFATPEPNCSSAY